MQQLNPAEIRVLGCLLEKQRTTPDTYPLSLNALRLACNQATNRDPVVAYSEEEVHDAANRLSRHGLARLASGAGSRAAKFRHLVPELLGLDDAGMAVLCVLLLRGAQTPGELRQRCERLHPFTAREEVITTLQGLCDAGLARWIARRPGQKEDRYEHLMGEDAADAPGASQPRDAPAGDPAPGDAFMREQSAAGPDEAPAAGDATVALRALQDRVEALERDVRALRARLAPENG